MSTGGTNKQLLMFFIKLLPTATILEGLQVDSLLLSESHSPHSSPAPGLFYCGCHFRSKGFTPMHICFHIVGASRTRSPIHLAVKPAVCIVVAIQTTNCTMSVLKVRDNLPHFGQNIICSVFVKPLSSFGSLSNLPLYDSINGKKFGTGIRSNLGEYRQLILSKCLCKRSANIIYSQHSFDN